MIYFEIWSYSDETNISITFCLVVWVPSSILVQEGGNNDKYISNLWASRFIHPAKRPKISQSVASKNNYRNIQIQTLPIKPLFTTLFHMLISQVMVLLFGQLLNVLMSCGKRSLITDTKFCLRALRTADLPMIEWLESRKWVSKMYTPSCCFRWNKRVEELVFKGKT